MTEDPDDIVLCESCDEPVDRAEAFYEDYAWYHPDCAGVWRCADCGEWNDHAQDVCEGCGSPRPAEAS